jgi:ADP-heptose:LPS heptosyltransferase
MRERFQMSSRLEALMQQWASEPFPIVALVPHFSLSEAFCCLKLLCAGPTPEVTAIYRPLNQPALDTWLRRARERFGFRLLSRRTAMKAASTALQNNQCVIVLFDQNAADQGLLTTFMGRVASSTTLPGLLGVPAAARFVPMRVRREGFWRAQLDCAEPYLPADAVQATLLADHWLEGALKEDPERCSQWLWLHNRWKGFSRPEQRFCLLPKRDGRVAACEHNGWAALPRSSNYWVQLPERLEAVVLSLPLLEALRRGRPDARVTLLLKAEHRPLLEGLRTAGGELLAEDFRALPGASLSGFAKALSTLLDWRREYPEVQVQLAEGFVKGVQARLIRAPQRFGICPKGSWRPLLTHAYRPAQAELDGPLLELWERCFRYFGLVEPLSLTPLDWASSEVLSGSSEKLFVAAAAPRKLRISVFVDTFEPGTGRLSVENWQAWVQQAPAAFEWVLLGTAAGVPLAKRLMQAAGKQQPVTDLVGQTQLTDLPALLKLSHVAVGPASGGAHLANALGVPVALVGSPAQCRQKAPVFSAPYKILFGPEELRPPPFFEALSALVPSPGEGP